MEYWALGCKTVRQRGGNRDDWVSGWVRQHGSEREPRSDRIDQSPGLSQGSKAGFPQRPPSADQCVEFLGEAAEALDGVRLCRV